ncbi:MAG: FAD-dependent oxidoreductase, partial [Calditrichaeota bacterium]|nr:FAD-dependent oxidoreductase [Calditrichota bacterium]
MSSKVVIIGGGLAGISAAVAALAQGRQPLLLERTAGLGGRARSLFARDVDSMIDNGQHVLAASYHETRRLLRRLGQENAIHFQQPLSIHFRFNQRRNFPFRAWRLPAPLHFLLPLLFGAPLSRSDRRYLFRWGRRFRQTVPEQLKPLTVRQWLDEAGQSPLLEQLLWEPLTLATLNTPLRQASAFLLYQVLQKAFLSSAATSGLG